MSEYLERNKAIIEEIQQQAGNLHEWMELWSSHDGLVRHYGTILSDVLDSSIHIAYKKKPSLDFKIFSHIALGYLDSLYEYCPSIRGMLPSFYSLVSDTKWNIVWSLMEDYSKNHTFKVSHCSRKDALPWEWLDLLSQRRQENLEQSRVTNLVTHCLCHISKDEELFWISKLIDIEDLYNRSAFDGVSHMRTFMKRVENLSDHTITLPE